MPVSSADGQQYNRERSGAKARKMEPITSLSLFASHLSNEKLPGDTCSKREC